MPLPALKTGARPQAARPAATLKCYAHQTGPGSCGEPCRSRNQ